MGAIADAIVAYAQPLLDQTDGSYEQMNKALSITQLCYNLALLPEDRREPTLRDMRTALNMDEAEFDEFRRSIVAPMVRRHEEMFPLMHRRLAMNAAQSSPSPRAQPRIAATAQSSPTDRYAPCPCNSGEKYKFCCGAKRR